MSARDPQLDIAPRETGPRPIPKAPLGDESLTRLFAEQDAWSQASRFFGSTAMELHWSLPALSSGARIQGLIASAPDQQKVDQNREISVYCREISDQPPGHLVLVSPALLGRARAASGSGNGSLVVFDHVDGVTSLPQSLAAGAHSVLSTTSVVARGVNHRHQWSIPGVHTLHVATPIFHPGHLHTWISGLPDLERVVLLPAQGSWEEKLAQKLVRATQMLIVTGDRCAPFEHPDLDNLPRLPSLLPIEAQAIRPGNAIETLDALRNKPSDAGRFEPVVRAVLELQAQGHSLDGERADSLFAQMADQIPKVGDTIAHGANLSLTL